jgi:tetratricopeptide (TPR) repeat protein
MPRILALLLFGLTSCITGPLEQSDWIEVRSANFAIFSNLPEDEAVALSQDLELFRAVVGNLTTGKRLEPRVPTRIFAFARDRHYKPFAPDSSVAGFFQKGPRRNVVAFGADGSGGIDARVILFHEYTHFLVHNQNDVPLPLWYDEGFAEFLGTLRLDPDTVFIGAAPMFRRNAATAGRPHGIGAVIRARDFEGWDDLQTEMFYLQAWQLVHFLILGPEKLPDLGKRLARYVRLVEQGKDEEAAFSAVFGMSFAGLSQLLRDYQRQRSIPALSVPRQVFRPELGHSLRSVPPAEIAVHLGHLALAQHKLELAEGYFTRAIAAEPGRARAHAGLGDVKLLSNRGAEAGPDYERALALAPDDYENPLDYAEWLHQRAEAEQSIEQLEQARRHYRRAIELAPEIPESHAMLGRTWLSTEEDPTPGIEALEHARKLLPGDASMILSLARLYERAGRHADALAAARRVAHWSQGELQKQASDLLAQLGEHSAQRAE